jgi:hypothetical protein
LLSENLTALESWFAIYGVPAATILAALLIVIGTPLIAAMAYFRRKEYETVRQRYLDGSLDKIIKQVEYGLNIFEYNWAHSIHLLRTFRDIGPDTPPELYTHGFAEFDERVSLETPSHYLLFELIGDRVFSHVHQLLTAFLHEADNFFKYDLFSAIKVSIEGSKDGSTIASRDEIFTTYLDEAAKKRKECEPYYRLLSTLQSLISVLIRKQYRFKSLNKFRHEPVVIGAIYNLKEAFKEDLSKYANNRKSGGETTG